LEDKQLQLLLLLLQQLTELNGMELLGLASPTGLNTARRAISRQQELKQQHLAFGAEDLLPSHATESYGMEQVGQLYLQQ
jgi:hypothetical protein